MTFKDFLVITSNYLNKLMFHLFLVIKLTLSPHWATWFFPNIQASPLFPTVVFVLIQFSPSEQPPFYFSTFWNPLQPWTALIKKITQPKEESLIYSAPKSIQSPGLSHQFGLGQPSELWLVSDSTWVTTSRTQRMGIGCHLVVFRNIFVWRASVSPQVYRMKKVRTHTFCSESRLISL